LLENLTSQLLDIKFTLPCYYLIFFASIYLIAECFDVFKKSVICVLTYCARRAVHKPSGQLLAVKVSCRYLRQFCVQNSYIKWYTDNYVLILEIFCN